MDYEALKRREWLNIEDDFLPLDIFNKLQTIMSSNDFAWFYCDGINRTPPQRHTTHERHNYKTSPSSSIPPVYEEENKTKFQFTHIFLMQQQIVSPFAKELDPILERIQPLVMLRVKANLLTRTPVVDEFTMHTDLSYIPEEKLKQISTSILYINTCDGYTKLEDGTKVESVANRLITFPANMKHTGTSCTNEKTRIVINFNYWK